MPPVLTPLLPSPIPSLVVVSPTDCSFVLRVVLLLVLTHAHSCTLLKLVLPMIGLRSPSHVCIPVLNYMNIHNSPDDGDSLAIVSVVVLLPPPSFFPALLLQQDLRGAEERVVGKVSS